MKRTERDTTIHVKTTHGELLSSESEGASRIQIQMQMLKARRLQKVEMRKISETESEETSYVGSEEFSENEN